MAYTFYPKKEAPANAEDYSAALEELYKEIKRLKEYEDIEWQEFNEISGLYIELDKKNKQIDLMAEQLTTPTQGKEWVKKYYEEQANKQMEYKV